MPDKNKYLVVGGILGVLVLALVVMFISSTQSSDWKSLNELEEFESVLENKISEIRLRDSISSANWAVFSDEDLIQKWLVFFHDAEVKKVDDTEQMSLAKDGGGGWVIDIKTETDELTLIFKTVSGITRIEINGNLFDVRGVAEVPLRETYDAAIERHGVCSPWD